MTHWRAALAIWFAVICRSAIAADAPPPDPEPSLGPGYASPAGPPAPPPAGWPASYPYGAAPVVGSTTPTLTATVLSSTAPSASGWPAIESPRVATAQQEYSPPPGYTPPAMPPSPNGQALQPTSPYPSSPYPQSPADYPQSQIYGPPVYPAVQPQWREVTPIGPVPVAVAPAPLPTGPLDESMWYLKTEFFHWNEEIDGFDLVNEDGVLWTLGFQRRVGYERFRAEVFGGSVNYAGYAQFSDGSLEPLDSRTDYFGGRLEYEFLFQPETLPRTDFFVGLGTRLWLRNLPDAFTDNGDFVMGYQETWWTFYPYVGMETRRNPRGELEFYSAGRIGLTAFTYEHASVDDITLYPKLGLTTQFEAGIRGRSLFLAFYGELMTWQESAESNGWLQPKSSMVTLGLKSGFMF